MKGRWCSVSGFAVMAVSQKGAVDASRGWTVALPKPRKDAYSAVLFWSQGAFDDRVCPWAVCSQKCLPDERHCHYDISLCAKCNRFWKKIAAAELSLILAVLVGVRHRKSILRFSGGEGTTQKASAGFFIPCSPALSPYLGVRSVCVVENPDMRPVCEQPSVRRLSSGMSLVYSASPTGVSLSGSRTSQSAGGSPRSGTSISSPSLRADWCATRPGILKRADAQMLVGDRRPVVTARQKSSTRK